LETVFAVVMMLLVLILILILVVFGMAIPTDLA
jgi:hypothetical protein